VKFIFRTVAAAIAAIHSMQAIENILMTARGLQSICPAAAISAAQARKPGLRRAARSVSMKIGAGMPGAESRSRGRKTASPFDR